MHKPALILLTLVLLSSVDATAATVELSVSGQLATDFPPDPDEPALGFSAHILLDSAVTGNEDGFFASSFGLGVLVLDGVSYMEVVGPSSTPVLVNDDGYLQGRDLFVYSADFISVAGDWLQLTFSFVDSSGTALADDSHPENFDLAQFDPFVGSPSATLATAQTLGGDIMFGPIEAAQLRPVPLPAAIWLLVSGCGVMLGLTGSRTNA